MKSKKILTSPQWQKLYPPSGAGPVQSTSFDITLLFKLLRENAISGLSPPSKGWDELPSIGDLSLPADMARIKYYRNGIAHGDKKMELSEQDFRDYWNEIKDALVRIVGYYATSGSSTVRDWETAIDGLLTDPLTEDDRKNVDELKSWYLDERELKEMIESLETRLERQGGKGINHKEFIIRCVVKIAGVGAWLGGTFCVLNLLKDNPEVLIEYVKYSIIPTGLAIASFAFGSIKITMRVETLDALDKILRRYNTSQLKDDLEKVLITEELKNLANGERIELSVNINEEKLTEIRNLLVEEEASKTSLKSFCVLPPKPSHQIINRLDEVEGLLEEIELKKTDEITVAYLSGKPGCGKSEMARQVGEKFYNSIEDQIEVKFVFTFNASSIETLIHSYIEFTRILGCPKDSIAMVVTAKDASLEEKIMQLRDLASPKLEKYSSWLMIVDNVIDLQLVSTYFPRKNENTSGNGYVLVTTQDSGEMGLDSNCKFFWSISPGMKTIDAIKTLKEISTFSKEQEEISEVAKALDFQPLSLACAAIYMRNAFRRESPMTWTTFLEEHTKAAAGTDVKTGLTYPASMKAAVMMALEKEISDSTLMLAFQFLSVMAPEPISLEYVVQYVKTCKPDTNDQVVAAIVCSSSLVHISTDGSAVSVHQVLHDCLQTVMSQHKEINTESLELLKMLKAFPLLRSYNTEDIEHIFTTSSLLIHFLTFIRRLEHFIERSLSSEIVLQITSEDKETANSLFLIGDIFSMYRHYIASEICKEISTAIQEGMSDKSYPRLAETMKKLGRINLMTKKYQQAKKYLEKAFAIQEKAYGHDDLRLATKLNELGVSLRELGQHEEAMKCFERALAIQEKASADDDTLLATKLNELGVGERHQRHHQETMKCFERVLAIQEKAYGLDDPRLISILNELRSYYRDLGQHQKAKKCFERVLAIQEKAYGHDDPRLISTLNELAVSHRDLGQHQEAMKCFGRVLAIQEKAYGHDDPRLISTLNELAVSHRDLGQHQEAMKCFERVLAIQEKAYGQYYLPLASSLNELGNYYLELGHEQEATKCFERALGIRKNAGF